MQQSTIIDFQSDKVLTRTLMNNFGSVLVFIFYSEDQPQAAQLLNNINNLIPVFGQFDNVKYFSLSAQRCPETFTKFSVEKTPFVIFTQTDKKVLHSQEINDVGQIFDVLSTTSQEHKVQFAKDKAIWHRKVNNIIISSPFIAFIKGTPENPKCGFTRTLLEIFKNNQIEYTYYDIIEDEQMRYWARHYSQWSTYPQIFINGRLIGGLDKIKELVDNGEFSKMIPASCKQSSPQQRYNNLIQEHETVVFIDGFGFENVNSDNITNEAYKKYGGGVKIYNVGIDKNVKDFVSEKVHKTFPFIVHSKTVISNN